MKEVSGLDAEIWIATSSTHKRVHVLYEKVNMVLDLLPLDLLKTKISSVFKGNKVEIKTKTDCAENHIKVRDKICKVCVFSRTTKSVRRPNSYFFFF